MTPLKNALYIKCDPPKCLWRIICTSSMTRPSASDVYYARRVLLAQAPLTYGLYVKYDSPKHLWRMVCTSSMACPSTSDVFSVCQVYLGREFDCSALIQSNKVQHGCFLGLMDRYAPSWLRAFEGAKQSKLVKGFNFSCFLSAVWLEEIAAEILCSETFQKKSNHLL